MLKDFRESFAADLHNPDFQREFIAAAYEEVGPDGVLVALREIAAANQDVSPARGSTAPQTSSRAFRAKGNPTFKTVRSALNALGLDFAVVSKEPQSTEEAVVAAT